MEENGEKSFLAKRHQNGEDCTSCRLVSGFGVIGMGIYVFLSARKHSTPFNRNCLYMISLGKQCRTFFVNQLIVLNLSLL